MLQVAQILSGEILQCPYDDGSPQDDRAYLLQIVRHTLPYMRCGIARFRQAELRQFVDCIIIILTEPFGMLHDNGKEHRQTYTDGIKRDHDQRFITLEERIHKQHIDRQTRRAGHERHHEHGQHAVFGILYISRRHDSRHIAAESHQHRDETTSVKSYAVHDRIHDKRLTGHIARVLHQTDEEKQDDDIGQERQYGSYALQHPVNEQTAPPTLREQSPEPFAGDTNPRFNPILRISAKGEGAPEDEIENCHHDRETQPRVGQHFIDTLQPRLILVIFGVRERFCQYTVHVGAIGVLIALLITQVIDGVSFGYSPLRHIHEDRQALGQSVVEANGNTAGRHTDQLFQFGDIQRVICLLQKVIPPDGKYYFLLLVNNMRREQQGLLQTG